MKVYTINGIEYNEEQANEWFNCKFCGVKITDVGVHMHEDQYGDYFCESEECVWEHIAECDLIEIESVEDTGEEEEE
tara:strand:- start:1756 stop:1986 length:231 start_codon:yes stop_codon:yes gene_type:complete